MTTPSSPARRVLGEKDPNAPLLQTQYSPKKTKFGLEQKDLARAPARPSLDGVPARAGQKRKIHEVEEVEHPQSERRQSSSFSVNDNMMSDEDEDEDEDGLEHGQTFNTSMPHPTKSTFGSSQAASQEDPLVQVDAEFEIHEEPSQQTLDTMHAVTLSQNNSQLLPHLLRPSLLQESSQVSLSLSSLLDFETNLSSQDDLQLHPPEETVVDQRPKTEEESRKEMLLEKAETLRTRLQLAIFKVRTNQISRPFARLQVPRPKSASPASPDVAYYRSSSPRSSSTVRETPETRVAAARARATMDPARQKVKSLSSLPMPKIVPTGFSARWADGTGHEAENIPSSPPSSETEGEGEGGVDGACLDPAAMTRTAAAAGVEPRTPVQVSGGRSRPGFMAGVPQQSPLRHGHPNGLTSSVIKGEAAHCLLELVRGGTTTGGGGGNIAARSGGVGMCGL